MINSSVFALYNKDNANEFEGSWLAPLARQLIEAPEEVRLGRPVKLSHFPAFSFAASLGFKHLNYVATTGGAGTGHFYCIDQNHAGFIGRALAGKNLDYLGIEFTTVAIGDCWRTLADQAEGASICELCIAHKSADEETPETCKALAYLVTKLKIQKFHLWSAEFEPQSVDAFADEIEALKNTTLQVVDICDVSKSPPEDEIRHSKLNDIVARNQK